MRRGREQDSLRFSLGFGAGEPLSAMGQRVAAGAVAAALAGALLVPHGSALRMAASLAVVVLAVVVRGLLARRAAKPMGHVVLDEHGVRREGGGRSVSILRWTEPFGVTLLTNGARDRLLFAVTTPERTRYLGARLRTTMDADTRALLNSAAVISDDDVLLAAGDEGSQMEARDVTVLAHRVRSRSQAAFGRIYLSAPHGEPIELDGATLRVGQRVIDLTSPLECRSFTFHESAGRVAAFYEATWVRQAEAELVLVAPTPVESGLTGEPPPQELRLAIDRLFMLPLRRALDGAPRTQRLVPSRTAESSRAPRR